MEHLPPEGSTINI